LYLDSGQSFVNFDNKILELCPNSGQSFVNFDKKILELCPNSGQLSVNFDEKKFGIVSKFWKVICKI